MAPRPSSPLDPVRLREAIRREARRLGFEKVGFAPLRDSGQGARLREWIRRGMHGDMGYLARDPEGRGDPTRAHPWGRTLVCLARSYFSPAGDPGPGRGRVALFARGESDYHDWMRGDLDRLAALLRERHGARARVALDTSAILERPHARDAGLGWIGKNTLLLARDLGSYFFLGEIVTDLELEADPPAGRSFCGTCRRCLDLCPTGAIVAPYLLDARLCISYLTIEHRGVIPRPLRPLIGRWIFGCDVCQGVCPWNKFARITTAAGMRPRRDLAAPELGELMGLTHDRFRTRYRGTPVWRARRDGFLRNVAVALGNSRSPAALPGLVAGLGDPSWLVRLHAAWGIARAHAGRPGAERARDALEGRRRVEEDARVLGEVEAALRDLGGAAG